MSDKPVVGGSKWTNEGIDPALAYWVESFAYWEAIKDRILGKDPINREELAELVHRLGASLLGVRAGLYELEVIGIEAKAKRTAHGKTPSSEA